MLGTGAHFAKQGFRYLDLGDIESVADAHDPAVFRFYPHDGFHRELDRLAFRVHDHGDGAAVKIHRGNDVGVGRGNVDLPEQAHGDYIRAADSGGVAVCLLGQVEHDDLLDLRSEVPLHCAAVAAGDVRIEARAADVLAHL